MNAAAAVTPERILKELSELWTSLGKEQEAGVLRACAMTMIVAADESMDTAPISETIGELMHDHPSRAILLRVRPCQEQVLESRVYAQCWMPFGRRQQICCEQIEVITSEASLSDVPRLMLGLLAPDLPVVLICRSPRLFLLPAFDAMLPLADKLIVDSEDAPQPLELMESLARRNAEGHRILDLAWTRLTQWRETIAAEFDNRETLSQLAGLRKITIAHRRQAVPSEAWYLAAWLRRAAGPDVEIRLQPGASKEAVELVLFSGPGLHLSVTRSSGAALHVVVNSHAKSVPFRVMTDWDLLREELAIAGRDRVYDEVLKEAIRIARG
jgi:glucose-6-phosphate dehydrogenase assembly protein OpcA